VILQAFTTDALSGAWVVAAVAFLQILFFLTLHSPAPTYSSPSSFAWQQYQELRATIQEPSGTPLVV
jgi:hypothetical protein